MTNTPSNKARENQSAAPIDLSDYNRSYLVGTVLDVTHLLVLDVHTTMNDKGDVLLLHSEYRMIDAVPAEAISMYGDSDEVYTPVGADQRLSGVSSEKKKYIFVLNHSIEAIPESIISSVSYARPGAASADARVFADKATGFSTEKGTEFTWTFNPSDLRSVGLGSIPSVLAWLKIKKQCLDAGFIPLSGGQLSDKDVALAQQTLTKTIDAVIKLKKAMRDIAMKSAGTKPNPSGTNDPNANQ